MTSNKVNILKDLILSLSKRPDDNLIDIVLFGLEREISDICYDIDLKYGILTDNHILSEADLDTPRGKQPIFVNDINKGFHAIKS